MDSLFFAIKSVDLEKRMVYGTAGDETPDSQGEILDYAGTKPYLEKWSANQAEKTDGKSKGNCRVMHGGQVAGVFKEVECDDASKAFNVGAYIVDDASWEMVKEGGFTGFSIGGKYIKKWKDAKNPAMKRVIIDPKEISLADVPANPNATFMAIKADGVQEQRTFKVKNSGTVAEEPKKGNAQKIAFVTAKKGMYSVRCLADLLQSLVYMHGDLKAEQEREQDGSDVAERFGRGVEMLAEVFMDMATEETAELLESMGLSESPKGEKTMSAAALKAVLDELNARKAKVDTKKKEEKGSTEEPDGEDDHATKAYKMACKAHETMGNLRDHLARGMGAEKVAAIDAAKSGGAVLSDETNKLLAEAADALKSMGARLQEVEGRTLTPRGKGAGAEVLTREQDGAGDAKKNEVIDPNDPQAALKTMRQLKNKAMPLQVFSQLNAAEKAALAQL